MQTESASVLWSYFSTQGLELNPDLYLFWVYPDEVDPSGYGSPSLESPPSLCWFLQSNEVRLHLRLVWWKPDYNGPNPILEVKEEVLTLFSLDNIPSPRALDRCLEGWLRALCEVSEHIKSVSDVWCAPSRNPMFLSSAVSMSADDFYKAWMTKGRLGRLLEG